MAGRILNVTKNFQIPIEVPVSLLKSVRQQGKLSLWEVLTVSCSFFSFHSSQSSAVAAVHMEMKNCWNYYVVWIPGIRK